MSEVSAMLADFKEELKVEIKDTVDAKMGELWADLDKEVKRQFRRMRNEMRVNFSEVVDEMSRLEGDEMVVD